MLGGLCPGFVRSDRHFSDERTLLRELYLIKVSKIYTVFVGNDILRKKLLEFGPHVPAEPVKFA